MYRTLLHLQTSMLANPAIRSFRLVAKMIAIPDENLAQLSGQLVGDELLGVCQLKVEVAVGADQAALVLGLGPLQADNDILVDELLEHRTGIDWYEAHCGGFECCVLGSWELRAR